MRRLVKRANDATSRRAARPRVGGSMPEARVGGDRTPATPAVTTRPSSVAEALGLERNIVEVAELDLHFLRVSSHRVNFGSDSLWYGSPQWQIEAFWRFPTTRATAGSERWSNTKRVRARRGPPPGGPRLSERRSQSSTISHSARSRRPGRAPKARARTAPLRDVFYVLGGRPGGDELGQSSRTIRSGRPPLAGRPREEETRHDP